MNCQPNQVRDGIWKCLACGYQNQRPSNRPFHKRCQAMATAQKQDQSTTRTDKQVLTLIQSYCETCPQFAANKSIKTARCRRQGCQCKTLWTRIKSKLFACPIGKFGRDEELLRRYQDKDKSAHA